MWLRSRQTISKRKSIKNDQTAAKHLTGNSKLELMPQASKGIKVERMGRRDGWTDRRTGGRVGGTGERPGGTDGRDGRDGWVARADGLGGPDGRAGGTLNQP